MYQGKLAILCQQQDGLDEAISLAKNLDVPLYQELSQSTSELYFLTWREGCLKLLDRELLKKGGLSVDIEPRYGEQHSWPAPKKGALAQAIGRKTKTIVDATTGWGQDSLHIFRMGYSLRCIERSPIMYELLKDGFKRLSNKEWVLQLSLNTPELFFANACDVLVALEDKPECIYIDPMFPTKRKKSALAKKSMTVLRDLLGDDEDKEQLFAAAAKTATKKVIVKCPDYAESIAGKPDESFKSKLLRYDVYLT
ncbi:MAG: class I SAM-dependent methyltransferase [Methylococcales symbiont of Hymedesmia sp. n. MRB-2018]|nr:MAG: class I SAM-dependent methyltransferase [Methylococcales symbiont of Hymedesmia sp. n. MRB-2018]KAF3983598.1 MAG: class I SAM-dependent methyltransferase [Methylococcales symbiont of Hymedesmia sp. n. MRB-2018]